jgi:transcriptional regulator with XRE-family HTH domain
MIENHLAVLVTAHCERTGDSLAAIAARGGLSRQTLSGLVNGGRTFPRPATLQAVARGLDLPYEVVRDAAMRNSLGGEEAEPRHLVSALTAHAEGLTDGQLEVVLAMVRALKKHSAMA